MTINPFAFRKRGSGRKKPKNVLLDIAYCVKTCAKSYSLSCWGVEPCRMGEPGMLTGEAAGVLLGDAALLLGAPFGMASSSGFAAVSASCARDTR